VKVDMTAFGELTGQRSARCAEIAQAFAAAGMAARVSDNVITFMWAKFFGFACSATVAILARSRTGLIARSAAGASLVSAVIEECGGVVSAEGYPPPKDVVEIIRGLYSQRESEYGPSILVDMEQGRPTEGEHTIGDLAERAAGRGVAAPLLTAARCALQSYELGRLDRAGETAATR
jgi:2-dehydropantoate 2-reductase